MLFLHTMHTNHQNNFCGSCGSNSNSLQLKNEPVVFYCPHCGEKLLIDLKGKDKITYTCSNLQCQKKLIASKDQLVLDKSFCCCCGKQNIIPPTNHSYSDTSGGGGLIIVIIIIGLALYFYFR